MSTIVDVATRCLGAQRTLYAMLRVPSPTWAVIALALVAGCAQATFSAPAREEHAADSGGPGHELIGRDVSALLPTRFARGAREKSARALLVRFWTDGCPYCERSLPAIEDLRVRFAPKGLDVIAVYHPKPIRNVSNDEVARAADEVGYHGTVAVDESWHALRAMWLDTGKREATSASFLIDAGGRVRFVHPGPELHASTDPAFANADRDFRRLETAILALVSGGADHARRGDAERTDAKRIDVGALRAEALDRAALARWPDPPFELANRSNRAPERTLGAPEQRIDASSFARIEDVNGRSEGVMLDVAGPGALVSIECPSPAGNLRVYVDGDTRPALEADMETLLPRTHRRAFRQPIPFAARCKVTCDAPRSMHYEIRYRVYPRDIAVESIERADLVRFAGAEDELTARSRALRASLDPTTFTYTLSSSNPDGVLLCAEPKASAGPRAITSIEIRVDAPDVALALRSLLVRMSFDGEETVACPLGDFFGSAPGVNAFESAYVSVQPPGDFEMRFVMPYAERFDFQVENAASVKDVHVSGAFHTRPWTLDERTLLFHARWRSSRSDAHPGATGNARVLRIEGRGRLAGEALSIASASDTWPLGAESIAVDGRPSAPRAVADGDPGTTRDPTLVATLFSGQTRAHALGTAGFTSLYRFRELDAIPFEKSLVLARDMSGAQGAAAEHATTIFYYARAGAKDDAPPLSARTLEQLMPRNSAK